MKGQWESNINVWFLFLYSQIWNCYFQNRIIMFQFLHSYICERFIYFQDRSAYSAAGQNLYVYVDRSWENINGSHTHECGNWDWGRAIPKKGIHKWNFPCSVPCRVVSIFEMPKSPTFTRFSRDRKILAVFRSLHSIKQRKVRNSPAIFELCIT